MRSLLISGLAGGLFGAGLTISGMTDTQKVIGFLDVFGRWDITLMFVMGAGLLVTIPAFLVVLKKSKPYLCETFDLPEKQTIDGRLISGAALFGVGWGLYGYCPGPAVAALSYLRLDALIFVVCMLIGMHLVSRLDSQ